MKDKVVCITGGNGTIGKAIAQGLGERGAKVFIIARNERKCRDVVAELAEEGTNIDYIIGDVLDEKAMAHAVTQVISKAGKVDVLINGAGGNMPGATIMPDQTLFDLKIEEFKKVNDLNLLGTVIPTIAFAKPMVKQKSGCIINISSMSAILPLTRVVGYSASKAAIDNFTRSMAVEVLNKYGEGIRVNAIAPGFLVADQNRDLLLNQDGSLTDRGKTIISQTPMKRFGKPEELVSTILWLCDDRSSFITGIIVPIDGGFSAFSGV
ncbi:SDR family oxidoreductase [Portibacter marinus]|uniref:SDR family oxidoreductase n=1 Tax=Portibacter marinus TaxID=2898660 RepID=UPI001F171DCA|nr:SDR family oxidoreductase [Portibacter marinus]